MPALPGTLPARPAPKSVPVPGKFPAPAAVQFGKISAAAGHRVVLYGPGGIGKTTLATLAPGPVAFVDLDESLARLQSQLTVKPLVVDVKDWFQLRAALAAPGWDTVKTIVIDSVTKAEELAVAATLKDVRHEKGHKVDRLEDYGFGKGYTHVFDTFLPLLADLDVHARAGRNVVLICHDCTSNVPNPSGDDWLRYEPRLQSPSSGKSSIRLRVREWADHVLFIGYDVAVNEEGKGKGSGTRTIYPAELPHCMAKSRTMQEPFAVEGGSVWASVIK
jgi:hypothetical protein